MADDINKVQSRRALLAAAAGGAAALAASAALPLTAAAANGDPLLIGTANAGTAPTTLDNATDGSTGFKVTAVGAAAAVESFSSGAAAVYAYSMNGDNVVPIANTNFTGVYGFSPTGGEVGIGAGVWGDSEDWGVYGSGFIGVWGYGAVGIVGEAAGTSSPGIVALGATITSPALEVQGKVKFSRSGRKLIGAGKSSVNIALPGTTTASKVFAVLATNRSGRYVRAVVPATGQFSIYLNTSVTSNSYISWFILD